MAITPAHDSVSTSPTNTFATFNILTEPNVTTGHTFSDGNLKLDFSTAPLIFPSVLGSIAIPNDSGIWYWEVHLTSSNNTGLGVYNENTNLTTDYGTYQSELTDAGLIKFGGSSLQKVYLNTLTEIASSLSSPIIFQFIFDAVNRKLFIKYNNTEPSGQSISSGTSLFPVFSAGKTYTPAFYHGDGGSGTKSGTFILNHGQDHTFGGYPNSLASSSGYSDANGIGKFYYQPPTGALALCTANLPDPAIDPNQDLPEDYFKAVTWTGSNTNINIDFVNFTPDFLWVKNRYDSAGSGISHSLIDTVRGDTKQLASDDTAAQTTIANLSTFNSNNTVTLLGGYSRVNDDGNNRTYIGWGWAAGGAPSSSDPYMVDNVSKSAANAFSGSYTITPTRASIGTKQGFSIISYTGPGTDTAGTLPHGLGKEPEFVITKSTNNAYSWIVYHKSAGTTHYTQLDASNAFGNDATTYNGPHDANVIKYGGTQVVANGNYIVYAFTSIPGYSSFGSYTGNGSATDGPFIYTGFKISLLITKRADNSSSSDWNIVDNARASYNPVGPYLYANGSNAEGSATIYDFLSNGFKIRESGDGTNASGSTYIYAAFAEMPFKYANAR